MTIDEMPAGRVMDALVAELMGVHLTLPNYPQGMYPDPYSTNIVAAWEVVDAMSRRGIWLSVSDHRHGLYGIDNPEPHWWVTWMRTDREINPTCPEGDIEWETQADTAPLAICRAALKAVTPSTEEKP